MRNTDYFYQKRVMIVGLGRSGLACANLLSDLGAKVSITEHKDNDLLRKSAASLKAKGINLELGKHSQEFIKDRDLIVVSPGVPESALPLAWAKALKIPVISEIEVAWILCPATIIAITGSNGKTTVTTLIGKILEAKGKRVFVCGNIGRPFCQELPKIKASDFVSLEVSSFQLEKIDKFKPKIAVILNFSRNHLDRYHNLQEYLAAKKRILMHQDETDYLVLNSEVPVLRALAKEARSKVVYFSPVSGLSPNQSAVLTVGALLGIDKESCLGVFRNFKGVEHRQEEVAEVNNVRFINDSKATTVEATIYALENIDQPIIIIAGGKDKGLDYRMILDIARKKIKEVVLIGESKAKIKAAFKGSLPLSEAHTLEEAVQIAFSHSLPGDCVLISPMCSSFDMFTDYEERGRVFKQAVLDLKMRNK